MIDMLFMKSLTVVGSEKNGVWRRDVHDVQEAARMGSNQSARRIGVGRTCGRTISSAVSTSADISKIMPASASAAHSKHAAKYAAGG